MPRKQIVKRAPIDPLIRSDIYNACQHKCAHCGKRLNYRDDFTIEHAIPLSKGGTNETANLVALCKDCNKAKSNDIIQPAEYYPHLPEQKYKQLQRLFDKYLSNVDYLDKLTLFELDRFDIVSSACVPMKNRKTAHIPTTLHIEKMREQAAFDWLFWYKARLSYADKDLIVDTPDDLTTPTYKCENNGTIVFLFSAYVNKPNWVDDENTIELHKGQSRNTVCIDLFVNPELNMARPTTVPNLYCFLWSIIQTIQNGIAKIVPNTTIECAIQTPHSDKAGAAVIQYMTRTKYGVLSMFKTYKDHNRPKEKDDDGYAAGVTILLFNGSQQELLKTTQAHGYKSPADLMKNGKLELLQAPLDVALDHATPDEDFLEEVKPKQKPSERKYRKKKKNAKKRH